MTAKAAKPRDEIVSSETPLGRAKLAVIPVVHSAAVIEAYAVTGKPDLGDLVAELRKDGDAITKGDTTNAERMLAGQAHALDAIFAKCARIAANIPADNLNNVKAADTYLRLGLKAQSQCRATWETLAAIRNPPNVAFVKQANIANGPQQVNNNEPVARVEENQNRPTELLEAPNAKPQWLDTRAPGTASAGNPPLETVATVHRAGHAERQSNGEP